ncbi:MAG: hypothetical protein LC135_03340 [Phycisphaerae bacterium]|nr:hypothetical protein [Phycisphaerae bacterium]MCZ2398888.1 hypothetical protein [Phycisphaerae bacterium]NUQ48475.1 hypothetical protein [Phycisphaerae bacterium]
MKRNITWQGFRRNRFLTGAARLIAAVQIILAAVGAALGSPTARAQVIEPDDFTPGADISQAFPGVTLSTVSSDHGDPRVFAIEPQEADWASTGVLVFGHFGDYPEHWVTDTFTPFRYGALRVDLDTPTTFFSIDVIGNDLSDAGIMWAFDAGGNLLGEFETGPLTADQVFTLVAEGVGPISSVVVGGKELDTVALDHIVIPEPGAGVLLLFVLRGLRRGASKAV